MRFNFSFVVLSVLLQYFKGAHTANDVEAGLIMAGEHRMVVFNL